MPQSARTMVSCRPRVAGVRKRAAPAILLAVAVGTAIALVRLGVAHASDAERRGLAPAALPTPAGAHARPRRGTRPCPGHSRSVGGTFVWVWSIVKCTDSANNHHVAHELGPQAGTCPAHRTAALAQAGGTLLPSRPCPPPASAFASEQESQRRTALCSLALGEFGRRVTPPHDRCVRHPAIAFIHCRAAVPGYSYEAPAMTGGCAGRNELGSSEVGTVAACAHLCDAEPSCVSFEYSKPGRGSRCALSTTCSNLGMTVQRESDGNQWYLKIAGECCV